MEIIEGAYSSAHIFTTKNINTGLDPYAASQIKMICDNEVSKGCRIRVMPDVHPGVVGTIGLTMTIRDRIMPNLVGSDIGCGMTLAEIRAKGIEGKKGVLWWQIRDTLEAKGAVFGLFENVDRLLKSPANQRGRDFGIILACLNGMGYSAEWRVVNAAEYGVVADRALPGNAYRLYMQVHGDRFVHELSEVFHF